MSTIENLLEKLDNSREALLVAIEPLPDEALLEKGVIGDWSVADALINQTAWEAELVTAFLNIDKNKRPDRLLNALKKPENYSQKRYTETQDRALDQVFDDLQQVRIQIEDWLLEFSEKDLSNTKRYSWAKNKPLSEIIAMTTFKREKALIPQLREFAQAWQDAQENDSQAVIPLTTVDINIMDENHDIKN